MRNNIELKIEETNLSQGFIIPGDLRVRVDIFKIPLEWLALELLAKLLPLCHVTVLLLQHPCDNEEQLQATHHLDTNLTSNFQRVKNKEDKIESQISNEVVIEKL